MKKIYAMAAALTALAALAETFQVSPGNGSFEKAAKNWKTGDTIILAPGEYPNMLHRGSKEKSCFGGLTLRAAIPGTAVFRGDRKAPEFTSCGGGVWKTRWKEIPETVFERDTMSVYKYCGTLSEVRSDCGTWTYDTDMKTLYVRTTDSAAPDRHCLTVGVTPDSGINLYCFSSEKGVCEVLLEGFIVCGYYSRIMFPDMRLPFAQKKVPWGVVITHTRSNVIIRNVTAFLNGMGIGFCRKNAGGVIENCRAFGNGNPFCSSGDGIGIFDGTTDCAIRDCFAADNLGHDIFLYAGLVEPKTVLSHNRAYGTIRVKAQKQKGFAVTNCIAGSYGYVLPDYLKNSAAFGQVSVGGKITEENLLFRNEKGISAERIFADPENFDCRLQSGVPKSIAERAPVSAEKNCAYFVKQSGHDSADGQSVLTAFGSLKKAQEVLLKTGVDLYVIGPVKGNLTLKGLKNAAVRGRGAFPVVIDGTVTLEDCENITLERLMPHFILIRGGKKIIITQSLSALRAEKTNSLRLTHDHFRSAELKDCKDSFVTACVFNKKKVIGGSGWSDYNAYAQEVPAEEKHSFWAKAELGSNGTFRNAWRFDGRAIDGMPAGPFRRQYRNVELKVDPPRIHSLSPKSVVITLTANIPFRGNLYWGPDKKCTNRITLENPSCTHHIGLTELQPDQKYLFRYQLKADNAKCFSNAELKKEKAVLFHRSRIKTFSSLKDYQKTREYFVSPSGSDSAPGTDSEPFATIAYAVGLLQPGDTLTIRGGTFAETVEIPVSGTPDRPITIRGAKGEKVRLCGGFGSALSEGIRIVNQSNLIFENLHLYGRFASDDGYSLTPIQVVNSRNITFRNLLVGGAVHKIKAEKCSNLLIEDSVFSFGHEGLTAINTSITIRNSVFAFGGVNQITLRNRGGEKCILENCIIFDMLNMKGLNPLVHIHDIAAFTERNNCFHTRFANETKQIYGWNVNGKTMTGKNSIERLPNFPYLGLFRDSYEGYLKRTGRERTSFFANPGLRICPDFMIKYKNLEDFRKTGKNNEKFSWEEQKKSVLIGREDFTNYLPTHPEVIRRGCGPRIK